MTKTTIHAQYLVLLSETLIPAAVEAAIVDATSRGIDLSGWEAEFDGQLGTFGAHYRIVDGTFISLYSTPAWEQDGDETRFRCVPTSLMHDGDLIEDERARAVAVDWTGNGREDARAFAAAFVSALSGLDVASFQAKAKAEAQAQVIEDLAAAVQNRWGNLGDCQASIGVELSELLYKVVELSEV